jgi:N-methylhydantoinase A
MTEVEQSALPSLTAALTRLDWEAQQRLHRERVPDDRRILEHSLEVRYLGQNYELDVPLPSGGPMESAEVIRRRFEQAHLQAYGFRSDDPVQVVNVRVRAGARTISAHRDPCPTIEDRAAVPARHRDVYLDAETPVPCPVFARKTLMPGHRFVGPAIVEQMDSTTVILAGQRVYVDAFENLIIEATP